MILERSTGQVLNLLIQQELLDPRSQVVIERKFLDSQLV
jgi:hypothetical protein